MKKNVFLTEIALLLNETASFIEHLMTHAHLETLPANLPDMFVILALALKRMRAIPRAIATEKAKVQRRKNCGVKLGRDSGCDPWDTPPPTTPCPCAIKPRLRACRLMRMLLPTRSLPLEFDIEVAGHGCEDVVASADVAEALSSSLLSMLFLLVTPLLLLLLWLFWVSRASLAALWLSFLCYLRPRASGWLVAVLGCSRGPETAHE